MSRKIVVHKAVRIEGNAEIHFEFDDGQLKSARFQLPDFRGFEKFLQGRHVEHVPHMISRICGLCSVCHFVAALQSIENGLEIPVSNSVHLLRRIAVLGEWISSHALSFFFLTMPDFIGSTGGIFEMLHTNPEMTKEALFLRKAGQEITKLIAGRAIHPVSMSLGMFRQMPIQEDLNQVRKLATDVKDLLAKLIHKEGRNPIRQGQILFPEEPVHLLAYDDRPGKDAFYVFNRKGELIKQFGKEELPTTLSEIRAEWTYAKFPYLTEMGFPKGILLVGPVARTFMKGGILHDNEIAEFELTQIILDGDIVNVQFFHLFRLLEMFLSAKKIVHMTDQVDLDEKDSKIDVIKSGFGSGIIEAPRGTLVHSMLINQGRIERVRLLVATQFNNAFINLLIKDLAKKHLDGNNISDEGNWLVGHCMRQFDPCVSCATH
jgi:coenzyme F420-reducing hydrogenase alpha subunit